jgi:hypothetical protein
MEKSGINESEVQIVVLQRGWVVIGEYVTNGEHCLLTKGFVIRRWGTSTGLGELRQGPTAKSTLDPIQNVQWHILAQIFTQKPNQKIWREVMDAYTWQPQDLSLDQPSTGLLISVLQRGWVVLGNFTSEGEFDYMDKGYVVRKWGTSEGLGQLHGGPTKETILDPIQDVRNHNLAKIFTIKVDQDAWLKQLDSTVWIPETQTKPNISVKEWMKKKGNNS